MLHHMTTEPGEREGEGREHIKKNKIRRACRLFIITPVHNYYKEPINKFINEYDVLHMRACLWLLQSPTIPVSQLYPAKINASTIVSLLSTYI